MGSYCGAIRNIRDLPVLVMASGITEPESLACWIWHEKRVNKVETSRYRERIDLESIQKPDCP